MRKKNVIDVEEILEFDEEEIMEEKKMKKFNLKKIGLGIAAVTGIVIGGILLSKKGNSNDTDDEFDYDEDDELEEILDETEEILDETEN